MNKTYITHSEEETRKLGEEFAAGLKKGDVVLLDGPLGAGKTVFVKGVVSGLGFTSVSVKSPSFTLIHEYPGPQWPVYHVDLYRIDTCGEFFSLGYDEYFFEPDGITLVEWADKVRHFLTDYVYVTFSYEGQDSRRIRFEMRPERSS